MVEKREGHDSLSKSHFISKNNISMLMPSSDQPIETGYLILFKLLVRFFEFGHLSICYIILYNLIIHLAHDFLNLLIEQLPVNLGLLQWLHSLHDGINFLVALSLCFLFGKAKHFLMIPYKLIKSISLVLIQGSIIPIVIQYLLFEDGLKHRFRLPRTLTVRESSPLNKVQLVYIALVLDCQFNLFGSQVWTII